MEPTPKKGEEQDRRGRRQNRNKKHFEKGEEEGKRGLRKERKKGREEEREKEEVDACYF